METIEIGPGPYEEYVAQLGVDEDFSARNRAECAAFKAQIVRAYGEPPRGVRLVTVGNRHEYGTYCEVAVRIDGYENPEERDAVFDYVCKVEGDKEGRLAQWDAQARAELGLPEEIAA